MKNQLLAKTSLFLTTKLGKTGIFFKKHAPEIYLGMGIGGMIVTVIESSRATLKAQDILSLHQERMEEAREALTIAKKDGLEFDMGREKLLIYSKTFVNIAKLYSLPVVLGGLSLTSIVVSRNILNARYLAASAAFNAVSEAFKEYRKGVTEEFGEIYDRHFRYGTELETITKEVVDENGKKKKVKEVVEKEGSIMKCPPDGAIWFDEFLPDGTKNVMWDENPRLTESFLNGRMQYLNDRFHNRKEKFMFLNEVYDDLNLPLTPFGAQAGWILGNGDNYIDFGLGSDANLGNVRGKAFLLDFNIDGIIIDKIGNL